MQKKEESVRSRIGAAGRGEDPTEAASKDRNPIYAI